MEWDKTSTVTHWEWLAKGSEKCSKGQKRGAKIRLLCHGECCLGPQKELEGVGDGWQRCKQIVTMPAEQKMG